ncbi:hypothetical protein [Bacillus sp. 1P06AnD]|uniref:hypothetical protein n=1 Tax=Bacillus sp. 1P06AnD TaxID=3132208 RepID=UPI0039A00D3E
MFNRDIMDLPIAYIKSTEQGEILYCSSIAKRTIARKAECMDEFLDEGSLEKYKMFIKNRHEGNMEVNIRKGSYIIELYDVYISYSGDCIHHCFIPVNGHLGKLENQLLSISKRLQETDLDLFKKKEELEDTLYKLDELSGPFIPLSTRFALIPIFGDINERKMKNISCHVCNRLYEGEFRSIAFDFSATGIISAEGIILIDQLLQLVLLMDDETDIYLVGLNNDHVKKWHTYPIHDRVHHLSSFSLLLDQ